VKKAFGSLAQLMIVACLSSKQQRTNTVVDLFIDQIQLIIPFTLA